MQKKKIYIVAGGTFDHFHKGHELFLKTALEAGDYLVIGITSDKMIVEKPLSSVIEPFLVRKDYVSRFINKISPNAMVRFMKLDDPFGISIVDQKIDKIVVTEETKSNAKIINKIRKKNRLKALKILVVPYIYADDNRKISSFRVRSGEVSRHGVSYIKYLFSKQIYHLPDKLRVSLREPLGRVFSTKKDIKKHIFSLRSQKKTDMKDKMIITVGDIVTLSLLDNKITPHIMIYDYITRREALSSHQKNQLYIRTKKTIINQAGTIRRNAIQTIHQTIQKSLKTEKNIGIRVIGEEDLLVLPVILMAPLGSVVCYGQKDIGLISITVTEEKKKYVTDLLHKFS